MIQLPSSLKDKTNKGQKIFAFALLGATLFGLSKLINFIAPTVIESLSNIWLMLLYGIPLAALVGYIMYNPMFVWGIFKTISWKITKGIIKMDPLSVMDRYADYLDKKLVNVEKLKVKILAKKVKLERLISDLKEKITDNFDKGQAAIKMNNNQIASLEGTKLETNQSILKNYMPMLSKLEKDHHFLSELSENWRYSNEKLRFKIDAKREEYETLKEMAQVANEAKAFAKGDTELSKIYNQSIKEFEMQVSTFIAKIEDFEVTANTVIDSLKVEKQIQQDKGMSILENYKKEDLFLPDFSQANVVSSILHNANQPVKQFQLLKK